jgi:hypothetical protein
MSEEIRMIGRAAFFAWMMCAFAACSSSEGAGAPPPGAGGSTGSGGAIALDGAAASGDAVGTAAESGAADAGGDSGFVSGGALDSAPGIYIVPAGPDTPEVRYPISNPSIKNDGGSFRIDYNMPTLLVGGDQMVSLRGTLDAQGRIATVTGDVGTATCDLAPGDGFSVRCSETLTGIQVDLGEVQRMTQSLPAPMAALFVGVASRFSGEPIGVVEIR